MIPMVLPERGNLMTTSIPASISAQAFGPAMQKLRDKSSPTWANSPVGDAVIASCYEAVISFLEKKDSFRLTFSLGMPEDCTTESMTAIKEQLVELFGPHVTVAEATTHPSEVVISVYFT